MKKELLVAVMSLFLALPSQAQTIVISDVDDTLKISHVLDTIALIENSLHLENHFLGMSHLFNLLKTSGGIQFYYVSNALDYIQGLHEDFIQLHKYPMGPVLLRKDFGDENHKIRTISEIITQTHPTDVILIGDNSERDTEIYADLKNKFPGLKIQIFIHQLYSVKAFLEVGQPIQPGQVPYVTSVDLAFQLKKINLLSEKDYLAFIQNLIPEILKEDNDLYFGEMAFPAWMDCRDFNSKKLDVSNFLLSQYAEKLRERCSTSY